MRDVTNRLHNARTAIALAASAALISACSTAPPAPLETGNADVAKAVSAFDQGCMAGAPSFSGAARAWKGLGVPKINRRQYAPYNTVLGTVTLDGACGVGVKGNAEAAMIAEMKALLARRGVAVLEEESGNPNAGYAARVNISGTEMGAGVDVRPLPSLGFWTFMVLTPNL